MIASALRHDGFVQGTTMTASELRELSDCFTNLPAGKPGHRLAQATASKLEVVQRVVNDVGAALSAPMRVVRAILFDKREGTNWALGWHQDRTIEIAERVEVPGFGPFTRKQGRLHVAPPIRIVEHMVTIRLHVDEVDADNAPLLVAPGSHTCGFITEDRIADIVAVHGEMACIGPQGAVWFYATPILHRSARAVPGRRRRVLQCDLSALALPGGLRWAGELKPAVS